MVRFIFREVSFISSIRVNMKIIKSSDVLISENKAGNKKFWQCHIVQDGSDYYTQTSWYQITAKLAQSKEQFSTPYFDCGTNRELSLKCSFEHLNTSLILIPTA